MRVLLICTLYFGCIIIAFSQDLHFSSFESAPTFQNPAMTGIFFGNSRIVSTYREQWAEAMPSRNHFKSVFVSYDQKLNSNCRDKDFFSIGIFITNDLVSALAFQNTQVSPSLAYQREMGSIGEYKCALSAGASLNVNHQRLNYDDARWGNQMIDGVFYPNLPSEETAFLTNGRNQQTDIDPSVGFTFFGKKIHSFNSFFLSASAHHLTKPLRSFINDNSLPRLGIRYTAHVGGELEMRNARLGINPDLLVVRQSNIWHFSPGVGLNYRVGESKNDVNHVSFGTRLRTSFNNIDALIYTVGYDRNAVSVTFAYENNISPLSIASKGHGALELSLRYRFQKRGSDCSVGCPSKKL